MCIRHGPCKSLLPKLHAFTKRRNRPILSSALLFQKKKWLKKTSHTLFWMTMMTMKSLTLTLNLDHKVFNFSVSLSAVLFRLSFYEIPQNYSIINFKALLIKQLNVRDKTFKYKTSFPEIFVCCVQQINTSNHSHKNYQRT